jgi:hypothetical protein
MYKSMHVNPSVSKRNARKHRVKLKVLPNHLEDLVSFVDYDPADEFESFRPINNRSGIYCIDSLCWIEFNDGRSFLYNRASFMHELRTSNAAELNCQQKRDIVSAVRNLPKQFISKDLREMAYFIECADSSRATYRASRLHFNKKLS